MYRLVLMLTLSAALFTACRSEDKIQVFSIDKDSGLLTDTYQDILLSKPIYLKFAKM